MDDLAFKRLIFASVLGIQYHPRNEGVDHHEAIVKALCATELAAVAFDNYIVRQNCSIDDDILF